MRENEAGGRRRRGEGRRGAVAGATGAAGIVGGAGAGVAGAGGAAPADGGTALIVGPVALALSMTGHDRFYGAAYGAAGALYAVGQITTTTDATADVATVVAKLLPSGGLDTTFGTGGFVTRNLAVGTNGELCRNLVVQSTGKLVVACTVEHVGAADARDRDIAVARFNADGSKDTTFGTDGILTLDLSTGVVNGTAFSADSAWGLARYADDRLVVSGGQVRAGGLDTDFAMIRLSADGARDTTFGTNGVVSLDTLENGASNNASPRNVTILPGTDGVIGAGYQPLMGGDTHPALYKVTDAGKVDTTFATNGVFSTAVLAEQTETYEATVQTDPAGGYKLVTTGYGRQLDTETTDVLSLRLTSAGVLDTTWGTNGFVRIDVGGFADNSRRLLVLPDRRIMLFGGGRKTAADVDGFVALLSPDGQRDTTWERRASAPSTSAVRPTSSGARRSRPTARRSQPSASRAWARCPRWQERTTTPLCCSFRRRDVGSEVRGGACHDGHRRVRRGRPAAAGSVRRAGGVHERRHAQPERVGEPAHDAGARVQRLPRRRHRQHRRGGAALPLRRHRLPDRSRARRLRRRGVVRRRGVGHRRDGLHPLGARQSIGELPPRDADAFPAALQREGPLRGPGAPHGDHAARRRLQRLPHGRGRQRRAGADRAALSASAGGAAPVRRVDATRAPRDSAARSERRGRATL